LYPPQNSSVITFEDKWLILSDMSHIVAACYNKIVIELTNHEICISDTFYSIRGGSPLNPNIHVVCLGLIPKYVALVIFKDSCPIPQSSTE